MSEHQHPDPNATGAYDAAAPTPAERFAPGAVLAGRYRIVAALGRGGMGEVWRADDLTLGQPVALKFLPPHLADDPDRLQRFRKEVAIARKVSHPHCCRVYDLAEHAGHLFLTMEYIDGEDLVSALRRFGRLPEERAVEVARQLCQALAAVHEQGLLHRDLKPANVMLDGRGKVRLTDFGLAAAAEDLSATELRSGTPQYMAPEQLAGREVTARSDLFSLGLVLYELFTGKKAFAGMDRDTPPSKPSSHVSALDPAVERVILRCLEPEPHDRPASALAVAAALPGGDPLAAALAAGETPSPKLVASAGEVGSIRPAVGLAVLAAIALGLALIALLADQSALYRRVPLAPPAEQARRARQILADLGYPDPPADAAWHYRVDADYLQFVSRTDASPRRWDGLNTGEPAAMYFFYREGREPLGPWLKPNLDATLGPLNPPPVVSGMAGVHLDGAGRLVQMYSIPPQHDPAGGAATAGDWWWPLFRAAGFDPDHFAEDRNPQWTPPCVCDARRAWTGTYPDRPDVPIRVEAAAYRGRPVFFEVIGEWTRPARDSAPPALPRWFAVAYLVVLAGVVVLAARNLRLRRGDRRGAVLVALAYTGWCMLAWVVGDRHPLPVFDEVMRFAVLLGPVAFLGATIGLAYLALEPALRRRWPWRLTAWSRLLAGRWRDPLVGRDLLLGALAGVTLSALSLLDATLSVWLGLPPRLRESIGVQLAPPLPLLHSLLALNTVFFLPFLEMMFAFLMFLLLRREWLSWPAYVLLILGLNLSVAGAFGPSVGANVIHVLVLLGFFVIGTLTLARGGLLRFAALAGTLNLLGTAPLTTDASAWYAWQGWLAAGVVLAAAGYGFVTALGGQRLFREGFFGDA